MRPCPRIVAAIFLFALSISLPAQQQDFTVAVLPDTQYYSASYPQIFAQQTQWLVDHQADYNIQLVIGLGDIVDDPSQSAQLQNADSAVHVLDGKIPFALAIGNHDYDNLIPQQRQATKFNQYFGPSRYLGDVSYGGNYPTGSNENFYKIANLGGAPTLVLVLEYIPRSSALAWADQVLQTYASLPVIVVTHSYMNRDNTTADLCDTADNTKTTGADGYTLWNQFLRRYSNIQMVLSGHILGVGRRSDHGDAGNLVNQMLVDYQGWANGGNGYLRLLQFHPSQNRVDVLTYSPYTRLFLSDDGNKFSWELVEDGTNFAAAAPRLNGRIRRARIGSGLDCQAIASAAITLSAASDTSSSDSAGRFSFSTLSSEDQTVQASASTFLPAQSEILPQANDTLDLPMFANPDQISNPLCDVTAVADPGLTFCSPDVNSPAAVHIVVQGKASQNFINLTQLYVDGVKKASSPTHQLTYDITLAPGSHRLGAQARVQSGQTLSISRTITIAGTSVCDTSAAADPSVTVCSPANGSKLSSPVHVVAQSKDTASPVARMWIYLDGISVYSQPVTQLDQMVPMNAGSHRVTVQAKDANGTIFKTALTITVQ